MQTSYGRAALGGLQEWRIESFGGLDCNPDSSQIAEGRSPDLQNLVIDAHGGLRKRNGWRKLFNRAVGGGAVGLVHYYPKIDRLVFAAGNVLYRWTEGQEPQRIGLLDAPPTAAFVMNEVLWLLDGVSYWRYDGQTLKRAMDQAYVPLVYRNVESTLTVENQYEDYNLLSLRFRVQYSPDGKRTRFPLPHQLEYWYVNRITIEGELHHGFVFNAHPYNAYVELPSAPPEGINSLEIEVVLKENGADDKRHQINKCRYCGIFGGDNDTRIFLSGNPEKPSTDWHSGLYDPTFFPWQQYSQVGWSDDAIQGYSLQYDTMIIHKQNSTWCRQFSIENGQGVFPVKPVNDRVGLLARQSLQTVENSPAVLTHSGVYCLTGGRVRDERNMQHLSAPVDRRLLQEAELEEAISFDYEGRYGIVLAGRAYVYDYKNGEWLFWDHIPAASFYAHAGRLYFGLAEEGMLCCFAKDGEDGVLTDQGQAIAAHWQSKNCDLGTSTASKMLRRIYLSLGAEIGDNVVNLAYQTERLPWTKLRRCVWKHFQFGELDFQNFSFLLTDLPRVFVRKAQPRRFTYLSLHLDNDQAGQDMAVSSLTVAYQLDKENLR